MIDLLIVGLIVLATSAVGCFLNYWFDRPCRSPLHRIAALEVDIYGYILSVDAADHLNKCERGPTPYELRLTQERQWLSIERAAAVRQMRRTAQVTVTVFLSRGVSALNRSESDANALGVPLGRGEVA